MKRLAWVFLYVASAFVLVTGLGTGPQFIPVAQAAVDDCVGHNRDGGVPGTADCTKPRAGQWGYGYCPNEAANAQISQIECGCGGGTWDYNAGCTGSRPQTSEGEMVAQATCFLQHRVFCGDASANFPGWSPIGSSQNVGQCALYVAKEVQGIEISNYAIMPTTGNTADASGHCTVPGTYGLPAAKGRTLTCPLGYNLRGLPDGSMECWKYPPCPTCGRPEVNPLTGSLQISANDYPPQGDSSQATGSASAGSSTPGSGGGGAFPITFSRTYSNSPFYAMPQGPDRGTYGFNVDWVSNYDMHVFTDPTTPTLMGVVQREGGWIKHFDTNGDEIGVLVGSERDKLAKITDGSGTLTGYRYTTASGDQVEMYDATGNLLSIQNRAGLTQTLTYSDASTPATVAARPGLLIKITDPFGRALNLHHDTEGRIAQMIDPAGGLTDYEYDINGNLGKVTYPDDGTGHRATRQYVYNEAGYVPGSMPNSLTGIVDENGVRYASYHYHPWGFVLQREYAGDVDQMNITLSEHDEHYVGYVNGPPGNSYVSQRRLLYANLKGKVKATEVYDDATGQHLPCSDCGGVAKKTFDANDFLASTLDFNGNLTCYTNDTRGNETKRVEGLTGAACPGTPTPVMRTTNTSWDTTFHLPLSVAEPLRITTYTYDSTGNLLTKTLQPTTDTTGATGFGATAASGVSPRTWTYTYDANGQVLTANGPRTDVSDVTTYTYYGNTDVDTGKRGRIATVANALGQTTQITAYDAHGHPLTIVDPNGLTTQLTYDGRQRLTSRNVGGEITAYIYDDPNLLKQATMPDGSSVSYAYDDAHRLVSVKDNQGNRIDYTLDLRGNRLKEEVYDPSGQLAQTRSRAYDVLNRLQKDIGAQAQTTQYAYDLQGNLLTVSDPLNRVTTNTYDPLNRLATMTQPAAAAGQSRPVIGYAYNGLDQLTQVTDPRSLVTSYSYDGLSNLNTQVSPDTGTTANTYDVAGNILTSTDAKSQATTYTYDALNRVASLTYNQATGTQLKTVAYTYDQNASGNYGIGRLTGVTETAADGTTVLQATQYAYDQKGRLTQESRVLAGQTFTTAYAYNQTTGHLTGMTYPSGRTLGYSYDSVGRISQISTTATSAQGGQTSILVGGVNYQPFGGIKGYVLGNNQAIARNYDLDGRVAGYNLGTTRYSLGYDFASRIINILNTTNIANSNAYAYDDLDRLTQASLPATNYTYSYDLTGNRTGKGFGASSDAYAISATSNRLSQVTGGSSRSFTYDANGSTTGDSNNTYTYDPRGRMVQSQGAAGTTDYQVGANGQRVRKTSGLTGDTIFIYDAQGKLITEANTSGQVKKEYFYLLDLPAAVFVQ